MADSSLVECRSFAWRANKSAILTHPGQGDSASAPNPTTTASTTYNRNDESSRHPTEIEIPCSHAHQIAHRNCTSFSTPLLSDLSTPRLLDRFNAKAEFVRLGSDGTLITKKVSVIIGDPGEADVFIPEAVCYALQDSPSPPGSCVELLSRRRTLRPLLMTAIRLGAVPFLLSLLPNRLFIRISPFGSPSTTSHLSFR
jgi:hypothetical protein